MSIANQDQADHWNNGDEVGQWVSQQARYDRMLAPFIDMLVNGAALDRGDRVLDVGCGCGATTLAAARVCAPSTAVGVDLSAAMLERGRADARAAKLANTLFQQADAQVHPFNEGSFDAAISRFGIMFFSDPIAAFANLRRATRRDGLLAFVCWQPLDANEWLLVPRAALAQHLPLPEAGALDAPGMFAFADRRRAHRVLAEAGWNDVTLTAEHTLIPVGGGGTVDDAVDFFRTGSIGRAILTGAEPDVAARALEAVHDALEAYDTSEGVQLDAAVWLVQAVA